MSGPASLSRRLAFFISGGFALIGLLAVIAATVVLRGEQRELFDLQLKETARVLLPVLTHDLARGAGKEPPRLDLSADGALIYRLLDQQGLVLIVSDAGGSAAFPDHAAPESFTRTATHQIYTTGPGEGGYSVQFGDPLEERNEAFSQSLTAFILPILAILPIGYLLVGWIARNALRPLTALRDEIAARGETRLAPVDAGGQPAELRAITAALNGLMARLAQTLEGERAFASNAAHELRTPVAVALAQVQRLRAETEEDDAESPADARLERVEVALKRMARLVARLLQLARADAGIGPSAAGHDAAALTRIVAEESLRDPARAARLVLALPERPVMALIDPDAFGIVLGNLLDNAFQHAPGGGEVLVDLDAGGTLRVVNGGPPVAPEILPMLIRRFRRGADKAEGFGLGLHISDRIARQVGGQGLTVRSPRSGAADGVEVLFSLPLRG